MATISTPTFHSITTELRKGIYHNFYLLMGEESYFIDTISNYIEANVLKENERDFNLTIAFGADISAGQIVDVAKQYPLMAEKQVVIIKEAQAISNWEALESYLEHLSPTTILVICYKNGTIDKRKKILSKAMKYGVVFESKKKKESELPGFIIDYVKDRNASIDHKAAQIIADSIGTDLNRIVSEIEKLLISIDENRIISVDSVEKQIGISKEFNVFELKTAIINKDNFRAMQIVEYFNKNPKSGSVHAFLPLIFNYFKSLMVAHYCPNKNNERSVADFLGLKSTWAVGEYMRGLNAFTARRTMNIIAKIREIDARSKGFNNANTSPEELFKELVIFILL